MLTSRDLSERLMLCIAKLAELASEGVVFSHIRAKCLPILLYATMGCPYSRVTEVFFKFVVIRLFMKLFRTTSPVFVKCFQLAFNLVPVNSQLDIRTANVLQKFIASENSLCYLFALTACRKLNELFAQFDNVTTACQFHKAIIDSLTCLSDALSLKTSVNTIYN